MQDENILQIWHSALCLRSTMLLVNILVCILKFVEGRSPVDFFLYHNNKGKKIFIDRFIIKDDFNHLCIKFFSFQTEQHSIQKLCSASENKINIGFLFTVGFGNLIGCIYFIETYNLITIILIAHLWWWSFIMPLWFSRLFLGFMIQTSILP